MRIYIHAAQKASPGAISVRLCKMDGSAQGTTTQTIVGTTYASSWAGQTTAGTPSPQPATSAGHRLALPLSCAPRGARRQPASSRRYAAGTGQEIGRRRQCAQAGSLCSQGTPSPRPDSLFENHAVVADEDALGAEVLLHLVVEVLAVVGEVVDDDDGVVLEGADAAQFVAHSDVSC